MWTSRVRQTARLGGSVNVQGRVQLHEGEVFNNFSEGLAESVAIDGRFLRVWVVHVQYPDCHVDCKLTKRVASADR